MFETTWITGEDRATRATRRKRNGNRGSLPVYQKLLMVIRAEATLQTLLLIPKQKFFVRSGSTEDVKPKNWKLLCYDPKGRSTKCRILIYCFFGHMRHIAFSSKSASLGHKCWRRAFSNVTLPSLSTVKFGKFMIRLHEFLFLTYVSTGGISHVMLAGLRFLLLLANYWATLPVVCLAI